MSSLEPNSSGTQLRTEAASQARQDEAAAEKHPPSSVVPAEIAKGANQPAIPHSMTLSGVESRHIPNPPEEAGSASAQKIDHDASEPAFKVAATPVTATAIQEPPAARPPAMPPATATPPAATPTAAASPAGTPAARTLAGASPRAATPAEASPAVATMPAASSAASYASHSSQSVPTASASPDRNTDAARPAGASPNGTTAVAAVATGAIESRPDHAAPVTKQRQAAPGEVAMLLARGDTMLKLGDIATARMFYETAAEFGAARAAIDAGRTYDPEYLASIQAEGVTADRATAAKWYRTASELGDKDGSRLASAVLAHSGN